jgi:rSAM/selenodomain-associated transferase 2/rSAM/selenodomain-associated transferase 1
MSDAPRSSASPPRPASERLIVFSRVPVPGLTKTRLIPALGTEGAADLQRRMTLHALLALEPLKRRRPLSIEVHFAGGSTAQMRAVTGPRFACRPQTPGDIGARMRLSLRRALAEGLPRVVLVGTDCPGIRPAILDRAFDALREHDLVLGPAADGGYYLVGVRRDHPALFRDIPWSTDAVLQLTLDAARRLGLSICLVDTLHDVDRPEDLPVWDRARAASPLSRPILSVIIPTLNEAGNLPDVLDDLHGADAIDVTVADGASTDATARIARDRGVRVVSTPPGRAVQCNAAAVRAPGEILLFLHADTRLPRGFADDIRVALAEPGVVAGAFTLAIDHPAPACRLIERLADLRTRRGSGPYGDQAIFVRADTFRRMGGFRPLPIMEDYELVRRLRRRGRFTVLAAAVTTSARRWERLGPLTGLALSQAVIALYHLGVPAPTLRRIYAARPD